MDKPTASDGRDAELLALAKQEASSQYGGPNLRVAFIAGAEFALRASSTASPSPADSPGREKAVQMLMAQLIVAENGSSLNGAVTIPKQTLPASVYDAAIASANRLAAKPAEDGVHHKLDNDRQVFFYEQDFYVLSNFSAFTLAWHGLRFDTSEAAYHWMKFMPDEIGIAAMVRGAPSAHEAFKLAEHYKSMRRKDWDDVKVTVMRDILRAKAEQHEYVHRKLLATGDRELIEDSWRDDFWGWGPKRNGQNMLGCLWMEVRDELRAALSHLTPTDCK